MCIIKLYSQEFNNNNKNGDRALNISLTSSLMMIFNDTLSDLTYIFQGASLRYPASYKGSTELIFKFSGYNQKLYLLFDTVLTKFRSLEITTDKYEIQKESFYRSIAYRHCSRIDSLFLEYDIVTINDYQDAFNKITYELIIEQYNKILYKLYVEALIYGNINQERVKTIYLPILDKNVFSLIKEKKD